MKGLLLIPALLLALAATQVSAFPPDDPDEKPFPTVTQIWDFPALNGPMGTTGHLEIHAATDLGSMRKVIEAFQRRVPDLSVRYADSNTRPLYDEIARICAEGGTQPDVVLSSSVDLQVQLANDGCTLQHRPVDADIRPDWAVWRNEVFGFSFEPVVIVYNRRFLAPTELPRSRFELIDLLRREPERFRGRIGTYDIARSGVGYLLAQEDARQARSFGRLIESFGRAEVRRYCCTADILSALEEGELLVGYNLLGSYALLRAASSPDLEIVLPRDYTLVLSRAAILPRNAKNTQAGRAFLDFMLSREGQAAMAASGTMIPISPELNGPWTRSWVEEQADGPLRPIPVAPRLMVGLDSQVQARFLKEWRAGLDLRR